MVMTNGIGTMKRIIPGLLLLPAILYLHIGLSFAAEHPDRNATVSECDKTKNYMKKLPPKAQKVFACWDKRLKNLENLTARFTQVRELQVLKEPLESEVELYALYPDKMLWKYSGGQSTIILANDDELIVYYPDLKSADIYADRKHRRKAMRVKKLKKIPKRLARYFDISVEDESRTPGVVKLKLVPKRKRVAKRVSVIEIVLKDDASYDLLKVRYEEPNGNVTAYDFDYVRFNNEMDISIFTLALSPDVEVNRGKGLKRPEPDLPDGFIEESDENQNEREDMK